jgi:iron(III) transport system permease protein
MTRRTAQIFIWLGLVALFLTIGYPVLILFVESLVPGLIGGVPERPFAAYAAMWETPGLGEMLWNSLMWGLCTTLGAWLLGIPCGWLLARTNLPGKRWARILLLVPLMSPAYINALAYVLAMQPGGFADLLTGGLPEGLRSLFFSFWGVTFVMVLASFGGVALATEAVLRGIPSRLEDAAATLGAGRAVTFLRIVLPLLAPAIVNSGILVFLDAISNFGVPAVMGPRANLPLLPAEIYAYATSWPVDLPLATALSALLCLAALALLSLGRMLLARHPVGQSRPSPVREHPLSPTATLLAWAWFGFLFLIAALIPNSVVVATSFVDNWGLADGGGVRWTTSHYGALFSAGSGSSQAILTSLVLSAGTATFCVLLGALAAYGINRAPGRLAMLLDSLGLLPRMIPRIVIAIAFILAWNAPWITLEIYNTLWLLALAYFALYQSDALRFADSGMRQIGSNMEQAGAILGAGPAAIFRRIILPMLRPGLIAAWMTTFIVCMRDWVASIILLPPGVQTIGSFIFNQFDQGNISQAMAMTTCTVVLGTIVLVGMQTRRRGA